MEDREKKDVYEEKGVDEERGLRKLIDSEEESEEEEDKKSEKAEEEEEDEKAKKEKKKDDGKCFLLFNSIHVFYGQYMYISMQSISNRF